MGGRKSKGEGGGEDKCDGREGEEKEIRGMREGGGKKKCDGRGGGGGGELGGWPNCTSVSAL